jgi:hypothetical protein
MGKLFGSAVLLVAASILCKITFILALIATALSWLDVAKASALVAPLWWTCAGSFVVAIVSAIAAAYFTEAP